MLSTCNPTIPAPKSQDLTEKCSNKKAESRIMAKLLNKAGDIETARKMAQCGDTLIFREYADGSRDIAAAIYCKQRLCPTCQWRRSRKAAGELSRVMEALDAERLTASGRKYAWIALSYSPQNTLDIADIGDSLTRVTASFGRLLRMAGPAAAIRGATRCVEIRRSDGRYNPSWRGSWQVHVHSILCVEPSYFHSRDYMSRDVWGALIARALDIAYIPEFYIERIDKKRKRKEGTTRETCKYITKFEIPFDPNSDVDLYSLHLLSIEMRGRHFLQHYGIIRSKMQELFGPNSADHDNADLRDIQPTRPDLAYTLVAMRWAVGIGYTPYSLDPQTDKLLLAQLVEPAADATTGELVLPADVSRGEQIDYYSQTQARGEFDLQEYSRPAENPFVGSPL